MQALRLAKQTERSSVNLIYLSIINYVNIVVLKEPYVH
jgi:hypothetical protein